MPQGGNHQCVVGIDRTPSASPSPMQVGLWGRDVPASPTTGLTLGSWAGLRGGRFLLLKTVCRMGHAVYYESVGSSESQSLTSWARAGTGLPPLWCFPSAPLLSCPLTRSQRFRNNARASWKRNRKARKGRAAHQDPRRRLCRQSPTRPPISSQQRRSERRKRNSSARKKKPPKSW